MRLSLLPRAAFCAVVFMSMFTASLIVVESANAARTYPQMNYDVDPSADWEFDYPDFLAKEVYSDPEFAEAEALPDPTRDERFRTYNVIIVVNKKDDGSEPGQRIRVYTRENGLVFYWKVSTARAGKSTPEGYYNVQGFSSLHRSSLYNDVRMPWAIFFNGHIALHAAPSKYEKNLGEPASAGCVRLEEQRARALFHLVGQSGYGEVERHLHTGEFMTDARGEIRTMNNYKTLIIVK